mgnify:CR=1 FL=1
MELLPLLSDAAHYLLPAVGAWWGARGRLERLERDLRDHKSAPVPPAHALANGKGAHT